MTGWRQSGMGAVPLSLSFLSARSPYRELAAAKSSSLEQIADSPWQLSHPISSLAVLPGLCACVLASLSPSEHSPALCVVMCNVHVLAHAFRHIPKTCRKVPLMNSLALHTFRCTLLTYD